MTLLALDAAVRETGWAIFRPDGNTATGVIKMSRSRRLDAAGRISYLTGCLDLLVEQWQPGAVACGQPSGIRWPAPALELLDNSLVGWAARHRLPLHTYATQEIRTVIARHARVPQDQLAYAIMRSLRLIGVSKATSEWEALAVGYYHFCHRKLNG